VVTFIEDNPCERAQSLPVCSTMVKCYGRRLVINAATCNIPQGGVLAWVYDIFGNNTIVMVEDDTLISTPLNVYGTLDLVNGMTDGINNTWNANYNQDFAIHPLKLSELEEILTPNITNALGITRWEDGLNGSSSGSGHVIGIIDSGIAATALNLIGNILPGYDFISDVELALDGDGRDSNFLDPGDADDIECIENTWHGTAMSSIAAANAHPEFTGIAPDALIIPIRVLGRCTRGYASDVADAIVWAVGGTIDGMESNPFPVHTILMAFAGVGACPDFLQSAVNTALNQTNVTIYAAAGNDALASSLHFPANCVGVISVGALDRQGVLTSYSATGATMNQPGGTIGDPIPCLTPDGSVAGCIGTSVAVAYASGIQACVDQNRGNYSVQTAWENSSYYDLDLMVSAATCNLGSSTQAVPVQSISAGYFSTCAIYVDNHTFCWGEGGQGQMGNGNQANQKTPVPVSFEAGLTAVQLSAGKHSCAILSDQTTQCWGSGIYGQMGDGANSNNLVPTDVSFGAGLTAVKIYTSKVSSCAILSDGTTRCWGKNSNGQLGIGNTVNQNVPTPVSFGTGLTAVELYLGTLFAYAILSDGTIRSWGYNLNGQLNDGTTVQRLTPTAVTFGAGLTPVDFTASETSVCALFSNGIVQCWGSNSHGKLGDGTTTDNFIPTTVSLGMTAVKISGGPSHTCALLSDLTVWCWGQNNGGQIGDNSGTSRSTPTQVHSIGPVVDITIGWLHTCALLLDNTMQCWGYNAQGQLGDGTTTNRNTPTSVIGVTISAKATYISAGLYTTCAIFDDQTTKCWGKNNLGQVGDGTTTDRLVPTAVLPFDGGLLAVSVGTGYWGSCVLLSNEAVQCWGNNVYGSLGIGNTISQENFVLVVGLMAVQLSCSPFYTNCAIIASGAVQCWGYNTNGQLGDGTTVHKSVPTTVPGITAVKISLGKSHTCAILTDGKIKCWGKNSFGNLGDGTVNLKTLNPTSVSLGAGDTAVEIAIGGDHTCAILSDGTIQCWGKNSGGQLGDNSIVNKATPVTVQPFGNGLAAVQIACGLNHACAILSDGSVWCWGINTQGQLGDDTVLNKDTPVQSNIGTGRTAVQITCGDYHTCILLSDGTIWCTGMNNWGMLGDASKVNKDVFVSIDDPDACSQCAPGSYTSTTTATACSTCAAGFSCAEPSNPVACWEGYYTLGGTSTCAACPRGSYCTTTNSAPTSCSSGLDALETSRASTECFTPCSGGTYRESTVFSYITHGLGTLCAIFSGVVKCWGHNNYGLFGADTPDSSLTPITLPINMTVVQLSIYWTNCVILSDKTLKCWGHNADGQLGDGTTVKRTLQEGMTSSGNGLTDVVKAETSRYYNCAMVSDGTLFCWGKILNVFTYTPAIISLGTGLTAVDFGVGGAHACALFSDGTVKCWGANNFGQIGDNTITARTDPTSVNPFRDGLAAIQLTVGESHNCVILSDGTIQCWGWNSYGQIGDNTGSGGTYKRVPTSVLSFGNGLGAIQVASIYYTTHAILSDGTVWGWGHNAGAQIGDNTLVQRNSPVQIVIRLPAVYISQSTSGGSVILSDGKVQSWGSNTADGTSTTRNAPVDMLMTELPDTCASCAPGEFLTSATATSCSTCPAGSVCSDTSSPPVACLAGQYTMAGATVCQVCPSGYYCANTSTAPVLCPEGSISSDGSTACLIPSSSSSSGLFNSSKIQ
jgi:alpha-tubulin suppressor-like RCC1 family protein